MMWNVPIRPPLPVVDGVGPTRLRLPWSGPWATATVGEYVAQRFSHLDPREVRRRFVDGGFVDDDGAPVPHDAPLTTCQCVWYRRELPDEAPLPFREEILHADDDLVVVDKPHFLPTTPSGRFLRQTALVRLRVRLGNPDLTPIHRLDRPTAGLVLFSARPATRGAYQSMFEQRAVRKEYEAVSALPPGWDPAAPVLAGHPLPHVHRSRIVSRRGELRVRTDQPGAPNAETTITPLGTGVSAAGRPVLHTMLSPRTGRQHQLRVHLAVLGAGILGDRRYPELLPDAPDDHALPLQLLARSLEFTDPLSGRARRFATRRTLAEAPVRRGPAD
ncbi:pseudouridine synthase [Tomitella fengzijianii]|uniref:pseudouridine synthase n=1 Tax=Tomitella fengzijianii TaxID=2597660 RepID=UPI00131B8C5A|nr:pseudouridine synthase [Tomitella fengzijianii]